MTGQEILDKAKEELRGTTPTQDHIPDDESSDEYCEFCGAYPEHEPEETIYVKR